MIYTCGLTNVLTKNLDKEAKPLFIKPISQQLPAFFKAVSNTLGIAVLGSTLLACSASLSHKADSEAAAEVPAPVQTAKPDDDLLFAINPDDYRSEITDIWPRLRSGFSIKDNTDNPRLIAELNWYAKHQNYLDRVVERAEPFLHFILNEAEKRNLPTELVLLPVVESAYQAFAYSHGRAAGIWQFIPSTGKIYGLKQNWWYDGRRDIYASTMAAFDYLESLHREFKGDWLHALAAYNSGSGTVRRAIRINKKRGKPTDFWNLDLPRKPAPMCPSYWH